jgi:CRISPR-associated protein (TIGR03984 family)
MLGAGVLGWLKELPATGPYRWLLAHADDGIIWGQFRGDTLVIAADIVTALPLPRVQCAALREETLQEVRLFGEAAELHLWRDSSLAPWQACRLDDAKGSPGAETCAAFDEAHLLWGTRPIAGADGFTLVEHGSEGLRHVVPLAIPLETDLVKNPLRLWVRNYFSDRGRARVFASRLLRLELDHS